MSDPRVREATTADADALARVYRSAYRENRRLGLPADAESVTADEVADVTLQVDPRLAGIFARSFPDWTVVPFGAKVPAPPVQTPIGSLPRRYRRRRCHRRLTRRSWKARRP